MNPSNHFQLNLTTLLECLNIFGASNLAQTSASITYLPQEACFCLVLEENGVIVECELPLLMSHDEWAEDGDLDQDEEYSNTPSLTLFETSFELSRVVAKVILHSEPLKNAFSELADLPSAASVQFQFNPLSPSLSMIASGETTTCSIDFANSSDALIEFDCLNQIEAKYHLDLLKQSFRALSIASESYLRINESSCLSIQHMIQVPEGQQCFVDALVNADEEEEEEEEREE